MVPILNVPLTLITQLKDTIFDFFRFTYQAVPSSDMIGHLRREITHCVWEQILDSEFLKAYENGFDFKFWDGAVRKVYPRFLFTSVDYPEK